MPREIMHWYVIERAADKLSASGCPVLAAAVAQYPALALLGAIAHDVPYYYRLGKDPFEHVSELLHGRDGEDTLQPMKAFAEEILHLSQGRRTPYWAFCCGMFSHMAADIQFHPLVFYFTGNYHDANPEERIRAQGRHRLFETYLDIWLRSRVKFNHSLRIGAVMRKAAFDIDEICELLEKVLVPESMSRQTVILPPAEAPAEPAAQAEAVAPPAEPQATMRQISKRWRTGFFYIAAAQRLFLSSAAGITVRALSKVRGDKFRSIDSLFAFGRRPQPFFEGPLTYLNPISGEELNVTIEGLIDQSVQQTLLFAAKLEPLAGKQTTDVEAQFKGMVGSSLNFGLPQVRADEAKYFSETGAPLPGLRRT